MSQLPQNLPLPQMQTTWSSIITPFLQNNLNAVLILPETTLQIGVNTINHKLSRKQQGWIITDIDAAATIYRSAPFNAKTLELTSDAICTVTLGVF